ncbi:MAG: aspartate aminotransferase family protein [Deinococcota bacterium]
MSHLQSAAFFRDLSREPILITHAEGVHLVDDTGKRYLDAASGAAVCSLGHGRKDIADVLSQQAHTLNFAHVSKFATQPMIDLAEMVVARAPNLLSKVFFTSGGSESTEAAIKLARQYQLAKGNPSKYKVITRRTSYHGATLGALALSGQVGRRQLFTPMMLAQPMIAPTSCYRCPFGKDPSTCQVECADDLETTLLSEGPDNVAAFIAEPIVGSSAPGRYPKDSYWQRIREICDQYDVLFIADEVMSGNGRSGKWWAMQHSSIVPDMITTAKGISAGYTPLGAVLVSQQVFDAVKTATGDFRHGHTYSGNPISCAVGLKVIEIIEREGLLANVEARGNNLKQQLTETLGNHPHVGVIRGRGLLLGVEFVADKASKTPFDTSLNIRSKFSHACLERGLYIYQGGGNVDGTRGDHALLAPPFVIDETHIDFIVATMAEALDAVTKKLEPVAA